MLQTVLEIGKKFRESEENFKYHRFIRQCKFDDEKIKILGLSVPIDENFYFKTAEAKQILDENIQKYKLFYLTFKTSDADTATKYVFGDIYYKKDKNGKEKGNYNRTNAFQLAEALLKNCTNETIRKFRDSFSKQKEEIEKLLIYDNSEYDAVFINFYFEARKFKYWYDKNELKDIDELLLEHFFKIEERERIVSNSMLYRTICSGKEKNDIQFPNFNIKNKYKNSFLDIQEAKDLFYGINCTEKPLIYIKNTDLRIIVLPKGDNISTVAYDKFFNNGRNNSIIENGLENENRKEENLKSENEPSEELFPPIMVDEKAPIGFDLIFAKKERTWIDIIEIAGIKKSDLQDINKHIKNIKIKYDFQKINIIDAFSTIIGSKSKMDKKYQNHLCNILPKIYTASYFDDPILLPALIEKTEYNIRAGEGNAFPKYEFYFLLYLQNNDKEGEKLMKLKESKSYAIGFLLGILAKQLREPINSFEKSYIGNLSRRIATLDDLIKFINFINEKLTIHEKLYNNIKDTSYKLSQEIKNFTGKYNKDECSFGFFESYFEYNKKLEEN